MLVKLKASDIHFVCKGYILRCMRANDFDTFSTYIRINGKNYDSEKVKTILLQSIQADDTLGIFEGSVLIGAIVLVWDTISLGREDERGGEVGYSIRKDYRAKGVMSKVLREFVEYAFEWLDLDFIQAKCKAENLASERVLEHCGFENVQNDGEYKYWLVQR